MANFESINVTSNVKRVHVIIEFGLIAEDNWIVVLGQLISWRGSVTETPRVS